MELCHAPEKCTTDLGRPTKAHGIDADEKGAVVMNFGRTNRELHMVDRLMEEDHPVIEDWGRGRRTAPEEHDVLEAFRRFRSGAPLLARQIASAAKYPDMTNALTTRDIRELRAEHCAYGRAALYQVRPA